MTTTADELLVRGGVCPIWVIQLHMEACRVLACMRPSCLHACWVLATWPSVWWSRVCYNVCVTIVIL
jgi:hypothetical protein